jgi:5-methylcytosine-specific restriction endonuclease McrA
MPTYRQQLRDPRWQRRRLQVFERDGWTCQQCGAEDQELQVHHTRYVAGAAPWEVPTWWCS